MLISGIMPEVSLINNYGQTIKTNLKPDDKIYLIPKWKILFETPNVKNIVTLTDNDIVEYECFDKKNNKIAQKSYKIEILDLEMELLQILEPVIAISGYDEDIHPVVFKYLAKENLEDGGTEIIIKNKDGSQHKENLTFELNNDVDSVNIKTKDFIIEFTIKDKQKIISRFKYTEYELHKLIFSIKIDLNETNLEETTVTLYDILNIILSIVNLKQKEIFENCFEE